MKNEYDVIVVGAGPAGTHCARVLAKNGIKVILLERQQEIGEPNFSTAGTPAETLKKFDLPRETAPYEWNKIFLASPSHGSTYKFKTHHGYVFDFRKLKQWLAADAVREGAELAVGVSVQEPVVSDGKVTGVRYKGMISEGILSAKIVVDATGSSSFLSKKLKLYNPDYNQPAIGLELQMTGVKLPESNTISCWFGDKYVPNGYAWVFPLSASEAKVGLGRWLYSDQKVDLKQCLKKFIDGIDWLRNSEPLEFHGGALSLNTDAKQFVLDGFISLTNTINPVGGEGIRHALYGAEFAAKVATDAIRNSDTTVKGLEPFNKLWMEYSDNNWKSSSLYARFIYKDTNDKRMDGYNKAVGGLSGDEIYDILFDYKFGEQTLKIVKNAGMSELARITDLFR